MKGGYQMIDCTGLDLTKATQQTMPTGFYQKLKDAIDSNKPVYAYNCVWGSGKPCTPLNVLVLQLNSTTITATGCTLQISVGSNDKATVSNLAPQQA